MPSMMLVTISKWKAGKQYNLMLAEIKKGNESLKILSTGRVKKTEKKN